MSNSVILKTDIIDIDYLKNILGMLCWYSPRKQLHIYVTILQKLNMFWDVLIVSDETEIKLLKNAIKLATTVRIRSKDLSFVRNEVITTYPELKDIIESLKGKDAIFKDILNDLLAKYKSFVAMKFTKDLQYSLYNVMNNGKDMVSWYEEINKLIQDFYNEAQLDVGSTEIKYDINTIDDRINTRINDLVTKSTNKAFIPSKINLLNFIFSNKTGYEKGCVYMYGAPTGGGKTRFAIMEGAHMFRNGFSVVHITIENNEMKISDLYDSCLLGISTDELYNIYKKSMSEEESKKKVKEIIEKLKKTIKEKTDNKLIIKKFRPLAVTPLMIENYLLTIISEGIQPDVLIVDHVDLLIPNSMKREDLFRTGEEIVAQMKDIAERFNVVLILPTHVNRDGNKRKKKKNQYDDVISRENISRSSAKYELVDLFATINRVMDEKFSNKMRIYIDKNRDGIEDIIIPCEFELGSMSMKSLETIDEISMYDSSVVIPKSLAILYFRMCKDNDINLSKYINNLIEFYSYLPQELKVQVDELIEIAKVKGYTKEEIIDDIECKYYSQYDFVLNILSLSEKNKKINNIVKLGNKVKVEILDENTGELENICTDIDKLQNMASTYEENNEIDKIEYKIIDKILKGIGILV